MHSAHPILNLYIASESGATVGLSFVSKVGAELNKGTNDLLM